MFNIWSFHNLEAVVSSGLGGGSLIYANVLIRKDERWFVRDGSQGGTYEYWPVTRATLDPHYDNVERILAPQTYPLSDAPYSQTAKTLAFRDAARALGLEWELPNLAITFANAALPPEPGQRIGEPFPNLHGKDRFTCRLCGECDIGCNYGSKNTLDYNFLTLAQRQGAHILTRREVRSFRPRPRGGYEVSFVHHTPEREGVPTDTQALPQATLTCDQLILSAGALGSTYLLLKNRAHLPGLSAVLGHRFSGNGDVLSFATHCREQREGATRLRVLDPSHGPVITSTIRVPDQVDGGEGRGFYLQDAGYPEFGNWLFEVSRVPNVAWRVLQFAWRRLRAAMASDPRSDIGDEISDLIGDGMTSNSAMPLLGMGRDQPAGVMTVRSGPSPGQQYLELDWDVEASRAYYERVLTVSRQVAEAMGGEFHENPLSAVFDRQVTVHPLGGCPMGRNRDEGVVDTNGQVFGHEDLYVADGSVMPGPVGPNPSLTIAALADKFADAMIVRHRGRSGRKA
jgi:cholesterol oxidase